MTGPRAQDRAARGIPRWLRQIRGRLAAACLAAALGAALAIPVLTAGAGTASAASTATGPGAESTASKTVLAWGYNAFGQLGNGTTTTESTTPVNVALPSEVKVTQVRAGCEHTLALTSKGHVLAWGNNDDGELGDGTTADSFTPVSVLIPGGTTITAVRAGCNFSLALTSKGHVLAWGDNTDGQLGIGSTAGSATPVRVMLPGHTKVTAISIGQFFSLARTSKGHALAWGDNIIGQLGDGTTTSRDIPVRVQLPAGAKVKAVAGGAAFGVAVTSAGLFAWGDNSDGQLGDDSTASSDTPVKAVLPLSLPQAGHLRAAFAGCSHTLALFSGGAVLAWGFGQDGQLGDGSGRSSNVPVRVMLPAGATVRAISAGCSTSYALTIKGHVLAWGDNTLGQLGDGSTSSHSDTPVRADLPSGWRASALGAGPASDDTLAIVHKQ
jgi:alpha-tubulin suppressor-like RCC1 family protein